VLLLDNGKKNADKLLRLFGDSLTQRRPGVKINVVRKPSLVTLAPSSLIDEYASKAGIVVTGVGDGGVSTSCSVLDAYEFEKRQVPALLLVTEPFGGEAFALARLLGIPRLRVAALKCSLQSALDDELQKAAQQATTVFERLMK
jgi:hypothetical protein